MTDLVVLRMFLILWAICIGNTSVSSLALPVPSLSLLDLGMSWNQAKQLRSQMPLWYLSKRHLVSPLILLFCRYAYCVAIYNTLQLINIWTSCSNLLVCKYTYCVIIYNTLQLMKIWTSCSNLLVHRYAYCVIIYNKLHLDQMVFTQKVYCF